MRNLGKLDWRLPWAPFFVTCMTASRIAWGQDEVDPEEVAPTDIEESAPETAAEPVDLEEDDDTTEEDVNPEIAQEKSPTQPPPSSNTKKTSPSKAPASRAKKAKPVKPVKPKVDYSKVPWTYHQKRFDLGASLGIGWINDPAFDLFQAKNAHPTLGARGAYSFFTDGPLSVAGVLRYESFGAQGEAREIPTALRVHTGTLGAEARYHFDPRTYAYGRLGLGLWYAESYLGEAGDPMRMHLEDLGFSGDLSLGAAVRVAGSPDGRVRAPRVHVFFEGGFAYDSALSLVYEMSESGALRPAPVDLGALSMGGPSLALGAMVSY